MTHTAAVATKDAALIAGSASHTLAAAVEHDLARRFAAATIERFPDGECRFVSMSPCAVSK